tara:strand:- start:442 stop:654 length:213 start_codon:yes stop_codon:yes gene_type:complete
MICIYYKKLKFSIMQYNLEPGNYVINPSEKSWGIGQIQSIIKNKATVNFQHCGKKVINLEYVSLERVKNG